MSDDMVNRLFEAVAQIVRELDKTALRINEVMTRLRALEKREKA